MLAEAVSQCVVHVRAGSCCEQSLGTVVVGTRVTLIDDKVGIFVVRIKHTMNLASMNEQAGCVSDRLHIDIDY